MLLLPRSSRPLDPPTDEFDYREAMRGMLLLFCATPLMFLCLLGFLDLRWQARRTRALRQHSGELWRVDYAWDDRGVEHQRSFVWMQPLAVPAASAVAIISAVLAGGSFYHDSIGIQTVAFELPARDEWSTSLSEWRGKYWEMEFAAGVPGGEYCRRFLVPVYSRSKAFSAPALRDAATRA